MQKVIITILSKIKKIIKLTSSQDSKCDIPGVLPDGYSVNCRQKYLYRKLVSLDNKGEPATDSFKMPSGCACAYKHSEYSVSRFGKVDSSMFQNKTVWEQKTSLKSEICQKVYVCPRTPYKSLKYVKTKECSNIYKFRF